MAPFSAAIMCRDCMRRAENPKKIARRAARASEPVLLPIKRPRPDLATLVVANASPEAIFPRPHLEAIGRQLMQRKCQLRCQECAPRRRSATGTLATRPGPLPAECPPGGGGMRLLGAGASIEARRCFFFCNSPARTVNVLEDAPNILSTAANLLLRGRQRTVECLEQHAAGNTNQLQGLF